MNFSDMSLSEPILKALKAEGYTTPTPIQAKAIPEVLQGRDLIGCAQTGTGKTAAFALPILELLLAHQGQEEQPAPSRDNRRDKHSRKPVKQIRALVLSPTRELAQQIGDSFTSYGAFTKLNNTVVYGGVSQYKQQQALRFGVDVLVATPGRLLDLMNQRIISLNNVEIVVLDEADHMLDMGFIHDIRKIIDSLPKDRQSLLFSATMPTEIARLAQEMLTNAVRVSVDPVSSAAKPVEQQVFFIDRKQKIELLVRLLDVLPMTAVLVFSRTKHGADRIARDLNKQGVPCEVIHGDKSQTARQKALDRFKQKRSRVLVATDIAARGIDVEELPYVVNFDLPDAAETYVHRIGRTGRAGQTGVAISFCANDERNTLREIKKIVGNDAIKTMSLSEVIDFSRKEKNAFQGGEHEFVPAPKKAPVQKKQHEEAQYDELGLSKAGAAVQSILQGKKKKEPRMDEETFSVDTLMKKKEKPLSTEERIAIKLKAEGIDYNVIARSTGLTKDQVIKL